MSFRADRCTLGRIRAAPPGAPGEGTPGGIPKAPLGVPGERVPGWIPRRPSACPAPESPTATVREPSARARVRPAREPGTPESPAISPAVSGTSKRAPSTNLDTDSARGRWWRAVSAAGSAPSRRAPSADTSCSVRKAHASSFFKRVSIPLSSATWAATASSLPLTSRRSSAMPDKIAPTDSAPCWPCSMRALPSSPSMPKLRAARRFYPPPPAVAGRAPGRRAGRVTRRAGGRDWR